MKWLNRLLVILLGVFWLGVSLLMIVPALRGAEHWYAFVQDIETARSIGIVISILTLAAIVTWVLSLKSRPSKARYLSYETEHGSISISLKALQDFLSNLKDEFSSILALTPKVNAEEDGLSILLEVDVRSGESVPDMSRKLQSRVRKLIEEKVGVSEIKSIAIRVEEIVNAKPTAKNKIEPVAPPAGEVP